MNSEVRRRAYIVGLMLGIPSVPLIWWVRGPDDPFMAVTYPLLTLYLVAVAVGLWRRTLAVRTSERLMIVVVGGFYLVRLGVAVHGSDDLGAVTGELLESTFWNINLLFIFSYLAFDTRRAAQICAALYGVAVVILATRLVPDVVAGVHQDEAVSYLRVMVFMGANIALLFGLAYAKEQLAEARATAEAMRTLAHTDRLTQAPNRRRLDEVLDERLADARRYGRSLSVLILDIDAFKAVNDRYGHPFGDLVLQQTADILRRELRENDVFGRWGGEEFLVVAPETAQDEAEQLAERCREVLATHRFGDLDHAITASIGVASHRPGDRARDLVKRADDALYAAKRGGRNRVCLT